MSRTIKKIEHQRICFWTVVLEKTRVPWTARRWNQSILRKSSPNSHWKDWCLKMKLQYFGHLMQKALIWNDPNAGKDWRREEKGMKEDEMVGWHHWLNGHEFEQTLGVGDGQGCLACCSPWVHKESDTTEPLNYTHLSLVIFVKFFLLYKISIKLKTEKIIKPTYHQPPSYTSNTLSILFHL